MVIFRWVPHVKKSYFLNLHTYGYQMSYSTKQHISPQKQSYMEVCPYVCSNVLGKKYVLGNGSMTRYGIKLTATMYSLTCRYVRT